MLRFQGGNSLFADRRSDAAGGIGGADPPIKFRTTGMYGGRSSCKLHPLSIFGRKNRTFNAFEGPFLQKIDVVSEKQL